MSVKFGATTAGGPPTGADLADNLLSNVQGLLSPSGGKYVSGARTIIKVNGQLVAFAFSVSWTINLSQDEIFVIDEWAPFEYAPKRITVDGTIGGFYLPGKGSPTKLLWQANMLSFLEHKYIGIEIKDRKTDALLFKTSQAVIVSSSTDIKSEQLANITLRWKAIGWQDEMVPARPKQDSPGDATGSPFTNFVGSVLNGGGNLP